MNRSKAAGSIFYGAMAAMLGLFITRPDDAVIWLSPDDQGSYATLINADDYTASISEPGHGVLMIDYEPARPWSHYILAFAFGIAIGMSEYRARSAGKAPHSQNVELVTEHPRYPEFIGEDSDRSHFTGAELFAAFSSWLSDRSCGQGTHQNPGIEQGGDEKGV